MGMIKVIDHKLILIVFIIVKFILQFVLIHPVYELQRDENICILIKVNIWHRGYISVPPFTSWVSYLIQLLGSGVFGLSSFLHYLVLVQ